MAASLLVFELARLQKSYLYSLCTALYSLAFFEIAPGLLVLPGY